MKKTSREWVLSILLAIGTIGGAVGACKAAGETSAGVTVCRTHSNGTET